MKKGKVEIVFLLDRSGSMEGSESDTIGGFNSFLKEQQSVEGEAILTTILFDNQYEILNDNVNLNDVKPLTNEEYFVRGSTALVDAMCTTIDNIGEKLNELVENEKPEKVIFVVITDGRENASYKYTSKQLKEKINHQKEKYKWEFIFLSANLEQFDEAKNYLGIDKSYSYDKKFTLHAHSAISNSIKNYRTGVNVTLNINDKNIK